MNENLKRKFQLEGNPMRNKDNSIVFQKKMQIVINTKGQFKTLKVKYIKQRVRRKSICWLFGKDCVSKAYCWQTHIHIWIHWRTNFIQLQTIYNNPNSVTFSNTCYSSYIVYLQLQLVFCVHIRVYIAMEKF